LIFADMPLSPASSFSNGSKRNRSGGGVVLDFDAILLNTVASMDAEDCESVLVACNTRLTAIDEHRKLLDELDRLRELEQDRLLCISCKHPFHSSIADRVHLACNAAEGCNQLCVQCVLALQGAKYDPNTRMLIGVRARLKCPWHDSTKEVQLRVLGSTCSSRRSEAQLQRSFSMLWDAKAVHMPTYFHSAQPAPEPAAAVLPDADDQLAIEQAIIDLEQEFEQEFEQAN
jgi:hypothetical protein